MKKYIDYNSLNYVIYCRKSSESEDKQVQSIETQLRELNDYANKNNLNVVKTITESQSAHTTGRKGFSELVKLLQTKKADAVLVIRANRISRNPLDAGHIISLMDNKFLLYVRTSSGTCYTNSPSDKMMLGIELIFSKKDSDDKSEAVKEGFRTKYLKGTPGGVAPIGFKNTPHLERGARHWIVDEEKLEEVRHLLRKFLTGTYSGNKLAEYARDVRKLTTPVHKKIGGKLIDKSYINLMLKNPIYAGFFYSDGVRYELDPKLPRLISEEEHYIILSMLGTKHQTRFQEHENPYCNFLKGENDTTMSIDPKFQLICECGKKFAYRKTDRCPKCDLLISDIENPRYYHKTYFFNGTVRHHSKKVKTVEIETLKSKIKEEIIAPLSLIPELALWVKKHIVEIKDKDIQNGLKLNNNRDKIKESAEKEKADLRSQHRRGIITDKEYKEDLARIESSLPIEISVEVDWREKVNSIVDLGLECATIFEIGTNQAKREILYKSQSNLIWDEKNLYISRPKWLEAYINGVKILKSEIVTVEPNLTTKKPLQNKGLVVTNLPKYDECRSLLRSLESN